MELIMFVFVVVGYFAPTIVAVNMKHKQVPAIAIVNVLLGWTGVGWVIALAWAFIQ